LRQELSKLGWIEGKEYRHRVPICRAKAWALARACGGPGSS
jgi:hypothetical protein